MAEKTEAPTSRRIAEARKEGQVARSQELNAAVSLLVAAWLLASPGKKLLADLQGLVVTTIGGLPSLQMADTWTKNLLAPDLLPLAGDLGVILLGLLLSGIAINLGQTGFLWASKRLGFDLNRVNPLNGFKRLFSLQGLLELLKALLKLSVVAWVAYAYLRGRWAELLGLAQTDYLSALRWWSNMAIGLMLRIGAAYLILAILDYAYQRWNYLRALRMTKEEVKEELKQTEGDPLIKSRIRGQQRRMARLRMMANVPKADVVITNPTHLAIAVQYEAQTMQAPKVVAKGAHRLAERIIEIARLHQVPVIQNIPLARALYRLVEIDQEIPPQLYMAMAEVLAYVYRLRGVNLAPETPTP